MNFVMSQLENDRITFLIPTALKRTDWRDDAIHKALEYCNSDWIWFTEQDFYIKSPDFWTEADRAIENDCVAIGVLEGERIHPCCMFVKTEVINQTRKDFSIVPGRYDHFAIFVKDLQEKVEKMGILDQTLWKHYNGLSQNWTLASNFQKPNYKPDEFIDYLIQCMNAPIELDTRFKAVAQKTIDAYLPTRKNV
jgi:hypothetical protein